MNKFLRYLFLLSVTVSNVWAGEVAPVVLARMAFTNTKDNTGNNIPGIILELEEENIEPETKTVLVTKEVGTGRRKRPIQVEEDVALDAYRTILAPLIQNDTTITINRETINACRANLNGSKKSNAITKYFPDEKPETVIKNLNAALDTFYKKISDAFFVKESGINFGTINSGSSKSEEYRYSPILNSFFTALHQASNKTFEDLMLSAQQPLASGSNVISKDDVIADWKRLLKTRCADTSTVPVIEMMPFINLYNRQSMRTNSLRYVYNALMELGFEFKFEMDSISLPGLKQQAVNYATRRFSQWLRGNQPAKK